MLKLGYKASAEQFGPRELLDFSCLAEDGRVRLGLCQRPFPAVEAYRRPCAVGARLARRARRPHAAGGDRHQRADPDLPLPPVGRRAGFRHARNDVSGPRRARRRHRRVAERGAVERHQMAGPQGAARPAARVDRADQQIVDRGPGQLRRPVLSHRKRDDLRQAQREGADLGRRLRARSPRQWRAKSPRASSAPAARTRSSTPTWSARSARASPGPAASSASLEKMIEVKVSFDTDAARAKEDTRHWAALALSPEEKVGVEDPVEMERLADALPLDRAASRWIVSADPEEQVERDPALCRTRLHPSRLPRPRPRPAALLEALRRAGVAAAARQVWRMIA